MRFRSRMAKTRGSAMHFGRGSWRIRVLGEARALGVQVRHNGSKHDAVSDVIVENRSSSYSDWEPVTITISQSTHRDDLEFWCPALSAQQVYYHNFIYYVALGLPLTKSRYTKLREQSTKRVRVDEMRSKLWRITTKRTCVCVDKRENDSNQ